MGKLRVELATPGELEVEEFAPKDGKLGIVPYFYGRGISANIALLRVYDSENKLISVSIVTVSGITGKPALKTLTAPVMPDMERKKHEPKEAKKP
jgi:hypothetical protein